MDGILRNIGFRLLEISINRRHFQAYMDVAHPQGVWKQLRNRPLKNSHTIDDSVVDHFSR